MVSYQSQYSLFVQNSNFSIFRMILPSSHHHIKISVGPIVHPCLKPFLTSGLPETYIITYLDSCIHSLVKGLHYNQHLRGYIPLLNDHPQGIPRYKVICFPQEQKQIITMLLGPLAPIFWQQISYQCSSAFTYWESGFPQTFLDNPSKDIPLHQAN